MRFDINIGDFHVLYTGTVIGIEAQPIIFQIDDLRIVAHFENTEDKNQTIVSNALGTKELEIVFRNFNNVLGSGSTDPVRIGELEGSDLFFSFRVYALGENTGKTIHYTWLTRPKAATISE